MAWRKKEHQSGLMANPEPQVAPPEPQVAPPQSKVVYFKPSQPQVTSSQPQVNSQPEVAPPQPQVVYFKPNQPQVTPSHSQVANPQPEVAPPQPQVVYFKPNQPQVTPSQFQVANPQPQAAPPQPQLVNPPSMVTTPQPRVVNQQSQMAPKPPRVVYMKPQAAPTQPQVANSPSQVTTPYPQVVPPNPQVAPRQPQVAPPQSSVEPSQPQMASQAPMASSFDLTPEELQRYRKKFDLFDRNKDGIIGMREFQAVSKVMGFRMLPEELEEMFGRRDLDSSGGITFDEFVVAMKERARRAKERGVSTKHDFVMLRQRFLQFDRRKRGYIDADDAYPILSKELGFDEDKTEALVDMYDKNRDYRLTLPEFGNFYLRVEELKKEVAEAFQDFDQNKDGFVDYEEACRIMEPKGFARDKIKELIEKADDDQDGKLNYQEFLKFWDVPILK